MVWDHGWSESDSNLLERLQIEGAHSVVTGALKGTSRVSLLNALSWIDLSVKRKLHKLSLIYKMVVKQATPYFAIYVQISFLTDLVIVSVLLGIFAYLTFVLIGIKDRFSFHQSRTFVPIATAHL